MDAYGGVRLWLLRVVASWCGLSVGVVGRDLEPPYALSLVVLSSNDQRTLWAITTLAEVAQPASDWRVHREWVH